MEVFGALCHAALEALIQVAQVLLARGEIDLYADHHPQYADRLAATALTGETFARYPLNGYRLTLGYADLDTRPPIPRTGDVENPLHTACALPPHSLSEKTIAELERQTRALALALKVGGLMNVFQSLPARFHTHHSAS